MKTGRREGRHNWCTFAKVEAKVFADTHGKKLKEVELQILETQWPKDKAEALGDPLANKLTEVEP